MIRFGIDLKVDVKTYAKVVLAEDLIRAEGYRTEIHWMCNAITFQMMFHLKRINAFSHNESKLYFPLAVKLFLLGSLGRALGLLRINEGIAFFRPQVQFQRKNKKGLGFRINAYRPFLQEY